MVLRTLAAAGLVAMLASACFTDPGSGTASSTGSGVAASGDTGATDVLPGSSTGDTSTGSTQTGASTSLTSETGADPTTGATSTGESGSCPATEDFPGLAADPACAACLGTQCCATVSECADDPACTAAASCVAAETCANDWAACPNYAESKPRLDAISTCMAGPCGQACTMGLCAEQQAACAANPACKGVGECVLAMCSDVVCPPEDPDCLLACWEVCFQQNPGGSDHWAGLIYCLGLGCREP